MRAIPTEVASRQLEDPNDQCRWHAVHLTGGLDGLNSKPALICRHQCCLAGFQQRQRSSRVRSPQQLLMLTISASSVTRRARASCPTERERRGMCCQTSADIFCATSRDRLTWSPEKHSVVLGCDQPRAHWSAEADLAAKTFARPLERGSATM